MLGLGILLLSSGCASILKQTYDRKTSAPIKKIALLDVGAPAQLRVMNSGGVGWLFGAIGSAVEASEWARKTKLFTSSVSKQRSALGQDLTTTVADGLAKSGYAVTTFDAQELSHDSVGHIEDYSLIRTDADAILDLTFVAIEYVSPSGDSHYYPWIRISARLVSSRTHDLIYAQDLTYGTDLLQREEVEHFPSDATYVYNDFDALMTKADEAAAGLRVGVLRIASRIAAQLQ
jgi:hypothetical protein